MSSLSLPLRRTYVAVFWALVVAVVAIGAGIMAAAAGAPMPWGWSGAGVLFLLLPRAVSPVWFETCVRAWNAGTRLVSRALRRYILFVCYHTVFRALAFGEGQEALAPAPPADGSMWRRRENNSWLESAAAPPALWTDGLWTYGRVSGSRWTLVLFPILHLLNVLREEGHDRAPSSSTYTLY